MGMAEPVGVEFLCSTCGQFFVSEQSKVDVPDRKCPDCKTPTLVVVRVDVPV